MRRTPLRRVSAKKARANRDWTVIRDAVFRRDGWRCQGTAAPGECCAGLQAHHLRRRSQGGKDTPANLVTLCTLHHRWVHDHPAEAAELHLLAHRRYDVGL